MASFFLIVLLLFVSPLCSYRINLKSSIKIRKSIIPNKRIMMNKISNYPFDDHLQAKQNKQIPKISFYQSIQRIATQFQIFFFTVWIYIKWCCEKISFMKQETFRIYQRNFPYTVFINTKSGGKLGQRILNELYNSIGEKFVCDLGRDNIEKKLQSISKEHIIDNYEFIEDFPVDSSKHILICCGGDGTIRWVMDETLKLPNKSDYSFAFIPMGTGNDLFHHLIKICYEKEIDRARAKSLISSIDSFNSTLSLFKYPNYNIPFDRWKIHLYESSLSNQTSGQKHTFVNDIQHLVLTNIHIPFAHSSNRSKSFDFNNYFGIGVDGDISATFANLRRDMPFLFFHQVINKFWYGIIGFYKFCRRSHKILNNHVQLFCDGVEVKFDNNLLSGIVLTNIGSYAGGSNLWPFNNSEWKPQSSEDGIIEVVGITGLTHLAQIKSGLAYPIPIAQGKLIRISTNIRLPMQVDGEPWIQSPCVLEVNSTESVNIVMPHIDNLS